MKKIFAITAIAATIAAAPAAMAGQGQAQAPAATAAAKAAAEAACLQAAGFVKGRDFRVVPLTRQVAGRPVQYGAVVQLAGPVRRAMEGDPVLRQAAEDCRQEGAKAH